jgi:hypothetical protein
MAKTIKNMQLTAATQVGTLTGDEKRRKAILPLPRNVKQMSPHYQHLSIRRTCD